MCHRRYTQSESMFERMTPRPVPVAYPVSDYRTPPALFESCPSYSPCPQQLLAVSGARLALLQFLLEANYLLLELQRLAFEGYQGEGEGGIRIVRF